MRLRIQVLSDLHTEAGVHAIPSPADLATGADAVIIAGDTARAPDVVPVATSLFPNLPIILVHGNHEAYKTGLSIDEGLEVMRRAARAHADAECRPVHVLEDEEVIVHIRGVPVRFLGSTLWTDFALYGEPARDQAKVATSLRDFRLIKGNRGPDDFSPTEWLDRHEASKAFLRDRLETPHEGPTVVVTHHLPSMRSVNKWYRSQRVTAGYASRLDDLVSLGATLWVHGHTHSSCRWRAPGGAMVVCNPAGKAYQIHDGSILLENEAFNPRMVIDIRRGSPNAQWKAGLERTKI